MTAAVDFVTTVVVDSGVETTAVEVSGAAMTAAVDSVETTGVTTAAETTVRAKTGVTPTEKTASPLRKNNF